MGNMSFYDVYCSFDSNLRSWLKGSIQGVYCLKIKTQGEILVLSKLAEKNTICNQAEVFQAISEYSRQLMKLLDWTYFSILWWNLSATKTEYWDLKEFPCCNLIGHMCLYGIIIHQYSWFDWTICRFTSGNLLGVYMG